MYELRPYQIECVKAIWANLDKHSVASLPTGAGKSPVIAELIRRFLEYPDTHILLLTHKRELIRQNHATLKKHMPGVRVGIFCAGLNSKNLQQVTIASVQSIVNEPNIPNFEIIIIDEAHLIPHGSEGQYHAVFKRLPQARIIGLTATPFRMRTGMLHKGDDRLFDCLAHEAKTGELIKQGWLSPVRARQVSEHANLDHVHIRMGEFKPDEMTAAVDQDKITQAAVKDVLEHAADRTSILVFCAGVDHARHVEEAFKAAGQNNVAVVTESTSMKDRDEATELFKLRALRILVNVGVYTTGFDAPNVDCIVLLRATKSPGLYVQVVGRGLRKCEGKKDALLLDYGENISRHGPLDMITAESVTSGEGQAPVKTCPQCSTIIFAGFKTCPECGFVFPEPKKEAPKHGRFASDLDPISATVIKEYKVLEVAYRLHSKIGKPNSIRVEYRVGLWDIIREFICPMHGGYATAKAESWFARRGVIMPLNTEQALELTWRLPKPKTIMVRKGEYDEIIGYKW